ncbi:unnamed protein product [Arabis nemorensis]|uniref:Uncharacterized protein n=1 Tax=Arabis nemorensis TaxID=586526 RepID=A0A565BJF8_9BRAS|nr:unnamed protein product [Arabis nemorensis]
MENGDDLDQNVGVSLSTGVNKKLIERDSEPTVKEVRASEVENEMTSSIPEDGEGVASKDDQGDWNSVSPTKRSRHVDQSAMGNTNNLVSPLCFGRD